MLLNKFRNRTANYYMKLLYTIFSKNGTPGGHGFSFEHTLYALKDKVEIVVFLIGHRDGQIESLPYNIFFFDSSFSSLFRIRHAIQDERPDVIHCFDSDSYKFVSLATVGLSLKSVLTIAGGNTNPNYIPYCKDIILFSKETMMSYGTCNRFDSATLHYIPNRVVPSLLPKNQIVTNKYFTFLQVIRLNTSKHLQILSSLEFLRKLRDNNIDSKLILAGTVNSPSEKIFIESFIKENKLDDRFSLITDERVCRGSELLPLADCVIGTGRSVMEAVILGKCVLVPVKELNFPVLLDRDNSDSLFEYNFSGRTPQVFNQEFEFNKIIKLLSSKNYRDENLDYTIQFGADSFVLTREIIDMYYNIYCSASTLSFFEQVKKNYQQLVKFFISCIILNK